MCISSNGLLLRLLLLEATKVGISKCLLTIHKDNFASQAVARANGGLLTDEKVF